MASKLAAGNISPSCFVKLLTTAGGDGQVLQATAGDQTFGISQAGSRRAPLSGWDDGYCAILGENLRVYCTPEDNYCFLVVAGTTAPGDKLKSDANGNGVVTTTANDSIGAVSEENATALQLCRVRLLPPGTKL
jgi:hypothetical protein